MKDDCIFCKVIAGVIPSIQVYQDNDSIAFMDINPVAEGHTLIVPRLHSANLFEISDSAIAAAARAARRVGSAVQQALKPEGLNIIQCNGAAAAQSVQHFHIHVIPRWMDDGLGMNWSLIPGNLDEINHVAEKIRQHVL